MPEKRNVLIRTRTRTLGEIREGRRTERMLELTPANKTKHSRFAVRVCVKDWDPCIRVASPDEFDELIAQATDRVRVPNVDHLYVAISLWKGREVRPWSGNL